MCQIARSNDRGKNKNKIKQLLIVLSCFLSCFLPAPLYCAGEEPSTNVNASPASTYAIEDSVITQILKKKLAEDLRITSPNITVQTNEGIVVLTGTFDAKSEAAAAIEDIISTPGVQDIDVSEITLSTGVDPTFDDVVIIARIKGLYLRYRIFGLNPISIITIESRDGVVFLTGAVDDLAQRERAIELARTVPNVKKVIPNIHIKY